MYVAVKDGRVIAADQDLERRMTKLERRREKIS